MKSNTSTSSVVPTDNSTSTTAPTDNSTSSIVTTDKPTNTGTSEKSGEDGKNGKDKKYPNFDKKLRDDEYIPLVDYEKKL